MHLLEKVWAEDLSWQGEADVPPIVHMVSDRLPPAQGTADGGGQPMTFTFRVLRTRSCAVDSFSSVR